MRRLKYSCRRISLTGVLLLVLTCALNGWGPWTVQTHAENLLSIGLLAEPKSLNIWFAGDRWSRKVLERIYHPLYIREPKGFGMIPWLARAAPVYNAADLSYTVRLRPGKWSDGTEFTAADVAFTGKVIREFKIPRSYSNWKFIRTIEVVDKHTLRFHLERPMAVFSERTLTTPIVQQKQWAGLVRMARKAENPLAALRRQRVSRPVGMGPFMLKEWKPGAYLFLKSNRHFFARGLRVSGYSVGPYIDGIIFRIFETTDAAVAALKKGTIDYLWWGLQPRHRQDLKRDRNIRIYASKRSALYFLGFNLRKIPFNDVSFRQAAALLTDKDFIIANVLGGDGQKMDSVVPEGNRQWYCKGLQAQAEGIASQPQRIRAAYEILKRAGYTWEVPPVSTKGEVGSGRGMRLPDGSPMQVLTILTPTADYDLQRAMVGLMLRQWLVQVGIPVTVQHVAFSNLIRRVKARRDFDMFVLGYGRLSLDPDYLRSFFHSRNDRPRGWNMSGYNNPAFDRIADQSAEATDVMKRKTLICRMQEMLARDIPYLPLYNPQLLEGVRKDRFSGWIPLLEGIANTWSFSTIRPKG